MKYNLKSQIFGTGSNSFKEQERATTIAFTIAGRAITIKRLMLRRSVKQCKTDKNLVKESKSDKHIRPKEQK